VGVLLISNPLYSQIYQEDFTPQNRWTQYGSHFMARNSNPPSPTGVLKIDSGALEMKDFRGVKLTVFQVILVDF